MNFFDHLKKLYEKEFACIDLQRSRVSLNDDRMFLCGGSLKELGSPNSLRQVIVNLINASGLPREKLVLAEEKFNNTIFNEYSSSLVKFELLISEFSTSIAVVLESTGSFAEIGAFCLEDKIVKKLFVFMQQDFRDDVSFINSGPLKEIPQERKFSFTEKFCDLNENTRRQALSKLQEDPYLSRGIIATLKDDIFSHRPSSETFDVENDFHKMVFIAQIIQGSVPLTFKEIQSILEMVGLKISHSQLRLCLKVSEDFGLLKEVTNPKSYYIAKNPYASIKFKTAENTRNADFNSLMLQAQMKLADDFQDFEYLRSVVMQEMENA